MRRPFITVYMVLISIFLIVAAPFFALLAYEMIQETQLKLLDNIFLIVIIFCFPIVLLLAIGLLRPQLEDLARRGGL